MGEGDHKTPVATEVALLSQSVTHINNTLKNISEKVDTVLVNLGEGAMKFKDIEHNQVLMDLRIKTIEAANAQTAATKQSIFMMFVDKGIGVLLPWAAIAYMMYGKIT